MKIRTPFKDLEFHVFFFFKNLEKYYTLVQTHLRLLRVIPRLPHSDITRPVPRRSQDDVLNGINVANLERFSLSLSRVEISGTRRRFVSIPRLHRWEERIPSNYTPV